MQYIVAKQRRHDMSIRKLQSGSTALPTQAIHQRQEFFI